MTTCGRLSFLIDDGAEMFLSMMKNFFHDGCRLCTVSGFDGRSHRLVVSVNGRGYLLIFKKLAGKIRVNLPK